MKKISLYAKKLDSNTFINVEKSNSSDYYEAEIKEKDNRVTVKLKVKEDFIVNRLFLEDDEHVLNFSNNDKVFLNGYQSWTDTKEFYKDDKLPSLNRLPKFVIDKYSLRCYGDTDWIKYVDQDKHGYDIFYSRGEHEAFYINLNYQYASLIFHINYSNGNILPFYLSSEISGLKLSKGQEVIVFDYLRFDSYERGFEKFNELFPKRHIEKIFGYTSWYNYYQNINEEIILRDLKGLDSRFNLFQIDDGYETYVGDWLDVDKVKFPHGLEEIVHKIHEKGLHAGLWLAPLVAEEKSKLYQEHKDYFIKDENSNPLKVGCNWSGQYALDLEKEEVREYIKKCLEHYMNMGFDFFKLDFLYASSYGNDLAKPRAQRSYEAYKFLKEVLKDKMILGCGAYLMAVYQNFDYLRIGPDVSLKFDDNFYMKFFHRERVSTKVTLQNTIYRHIFDDRLFANDPDVYLLRDDNIKLNKKQKEALSVINAIFGSVLMTSDDISAYDEEKRLQVAKILNIFKYGTDKEFKKLNKNEIEISYVLNDKKYILIYNINKGVFTSERSK